MKYVFYIDDLRDSYSLDPQALDPARYEFKVSTNADDVFRVMNVVTGDSEVELPVTLKCRSMSVGDVYVEDGKAFFCAVVGWTEIKGSFAAALLAKMKSDALLSWVTGVTTIQSQEDRCECGTETDEHEDSCPAQFGTCGDCPVCGSLSPWRCGHIDEDGNVIEEEES